MAEAIETNTTSEADARLPDDLSILDQSAFGLAFHEEMERADPKEAAVDVMLRAMARVRAFIEARDAARAVRA